MARPKGSTTFKPQYIKEVDNYINKCAQEDKVPFVKGFALIIGVDEDTLNNWGKRNKRFFGALKKLKLNSEVSLLNLGLKRKVDPNYSKFILAANYGYVETSKTIAEGNQPVTIQLDMSGGYLPPQTVTTPLNPQVKSKPS